MREILFRGKRVDNGEWVDGNIIGDSVIVPKGQEFEIEGNSIYGCTLTAYDVVPETVGQYTGLTDNNGTKIFEGDIVQRRNKKLILNNTFDFKIVFIPVRACFTAVDISGGNVTFISDYINNKYDIEVIGNIHDNPELLDGVRNG